MARWLSDEQQRIALEEYRAGRTLREIAALFNVSFMTVRRVLGDQGVPRRSGGRRRQFPQNRKCTVCKETKPIEMFVREARQYSGYGFTCKGCHRNKQRKRSVTKFGLTLDQFEDLRRQQRAVCAICGAAVGGAGGRGGGPSRLAIDHDHSTGVVRGLLCIRCNTGIGLFEERVDLLEAARQYLSKNGGGNVRIK